MLPAHALKIMLVEPEIPQNTGNIARLCAVTGTELHLVRPMGFFLSEKYLKRAGMDYWDRVKLTVHDDLAAARAALKGQNYWLSSSRSGKSLWKANFQFGDWIIIGRETAGLPAHWREAEPDRVLTIPQVDGERCLNQSTATGILLYEALRQIECLK
jgi:tRNA (cytidine/uridine-2'-O-)-methyltransferase